MDIKHYIDNKLLPESQYDYYSTYGINGQNIDVSCLALFSFRLVILRGNSIHNLLYNTIV